MGLKKTFATYAAAAMLGTSAGSVLWGLEDMRKSEEKAMQCEALVWDGQVCSNSQLRAYHNYHTSHQSVFEGLKTLFFGVVVGGGAVGAVAARNAMERKFRVCL